MEIVQPKEFDRTKMKTTAPASTPKESESNRFLQWLLFKPQLHAVTPFETNKTTRNENTSRNGPTRN